MSWSANIRKMCHMTRKACTEDWTKCSHIIFTLTGYPAVDFTHYNERQGPFTISSVKWQMVNLTYDIS